MGGNEHIFRSFTGHLWRVQKPVSNKANTGELSRMIDREGFFGDKTAVSPVIGVVLMVGVAVLLASTVHVFVFSFADEVEPKPPHAGFTFETSECGDEPLSVTHAGGDSIEADQLYLRSPDLSLSGPFSDPSDYSTVGIDDGTVDTGDRATICTEDLDGVTVRVVWVPESGGRSVILAEWTGA